MSGPVPSPSMNGMMGSSGTTRRPSFRVMAVPGSGGFESRKSGISGIRSRHPSRRYRMFTETVEKFVENSGSARAHRAASNPAVSSGLHHDGARTDALCAFESTEHDIILTD